MISQPSPILLDCAEVNLDDCQAAESLFNYSLNYPVARWRAVGVHWGRSMSERGIVAATLTAAIVNVKGMRESPDARCDWTRLAAKIYFDCLEALQEERMRRSSRSFRIIEAMAHATSTLPV